MIYRLSTILAICFLLVHNVFAAAEYMGIEELVAFSDVVAVIKVTETESLGDRFDQDLPKKDFWNYAQKNTFQFISLLKDGGFIEFDQKKDQMLWAEKSFICAYASYTIGTYLVFLESVGANEWVTVNHELGGLEIDGNTLRFGWYYAGSKDDKGKFTLSHVKASIEEVVLHDKKVSFKAKISPFPINTYNKWRSGESFQKLLMIVPKPPNMHWPDPFAVKVKGFIDESTISKEKYQSITEHGGQYNVKASWVKGYLLIESIIPLEIE